MQRQTSSLTASSSRSAWPSRLQPPLRPPQLGSSQPTSQSIVRESRRTVQTAVLNPGMGGPPPLPEVNNDPENLFKGIPVREGLIARRMMVKKAEQDKDFAKAMAAASDELRKQQLLRRETRRMPESNEELVEYFLNTTAEDLEYEVARYRPRLTAEFFQYLDSVLGTFRFTPDQDEETQDKVAELDLLRKYLGEAVEALDKCVEQTTGARERLRKLLTAKDKKEMILEMAAANEIDIALMQLLDQNIEAAKAAEQEDAAKFMEKVKQACAKYAILTPAQQALMPQAPAQLGARSSGVPLLGGQQEGTETPAEGGAEQEKRQPKQPRGAVILAPGQAPTPTSKLII